MEYEEHTGRRTNIKHKKLSSVTLARKIGLGIISIHYPSLRGCSFVDGANVSENFAIRSAEMDCPRHRLVSALGIMV